MVVSAIAAASGLMLLAFALASHSYLLLVTGLVLTGYGTSTGAFGATVAATQGVLDAAVEDTGVSADPAVIDAARPTLNATMARADTVLKLKRQSRMKVSFRLQWDGTVPNGSNDATPMIARPGMGR